MVENNDTNNQSRPDWQERFTNLFRRTWEMEVLLFGFALVYLFKVPEYLMTYHAWIISIFEARSVTQVASYLLLLAAYFSVYILIISMIVHLFLRGFWIAIVGLNSAFPEGIQMTNLKLSSPFDRFFRQYPLNLEDFETKLERACSSVFAFTFLIVFAWLAMCIMLVLLIISGKGYIRLANAFLADIITDTGTAIIGWLIFVGLFIIAPLLYLIDFLTLGKLKSIQWKWFSRPYYYIYRIYSFLTLAFLSRPIYYTFISNLTRSYLITTPVFFRNTRHSYATQIRI